MPEYFGNRALKEETGWFRTREEREDGETVMTVS